MKFLKKIILFLICGSYFFVGYSSVSAFLGEDLGLDIYKNIDEGLYDLELKQYEYELTGQGESDVSEVVGNILASEGLECDIETIQAIEDIIRGPNPIGAIQLGCNDGNEKLSVAKITSVQQRLSSIKTTFGNRAEDKAQKIYEIARIGLYSDGVAENSPFDLMVDLQEIDRVIFSEEIEYNGEEFSVDDEGLFDFLTEDKAYLYEDDSLDDEEDAEDSENPENPDNPTNPESPENPTNPGEEEPPIHEYACFPNDLSGLDPDELSDLDDDLDIYNPERPKRPDIPVIEDEYYVYTDDEYSNGASWGGPFRGVGPNGPYAEVNDAWKCDSFFCIVIDFSMGNQNLLGGGQTTSIESILTKAAEHLKKTANANKVQSKMTTNNLELGLIIPNLSDLLSGFGIQIQTKPAPILNNIAQDDAKKDNIEGDRFTADNMQSEYYKNLGLDFERRNDLDIHQSKIQEVKILQESTGLAITYPGERINELQRFQESLREKNKKISLGIDKKAIQEDTDDFYDQFVELERFVASIYDFSVSMSGMIKKMKDIPTRKS